MKGDCSSILAGDLERSGATRISNIYLGAIIVINCAACLTPIELFLLEVWPVHGFLCLAFFLVPLGAGYVLVQHLPEQYYRIKRFELSGRIYEGIGIRCFKRFVPNGDYINRLARRRDARYRVLRDKASIFEFEAGTRIAERCHLLSLLVMLPSASYALMSGLNGFALAIVLAASEIHARAD
jgi:hypothetical protein